MSTRVLFMIDNVNHKGGAHFVALNQIELLYRHGFELSIFSGYAPSSENANRFPYVDFITAKYLKSSDSGHLLELINNYDIVCTPNEDSIFRDVVSQSKAYKIQWIHTNYAEWKDTSPYSRNVTKDDSRIYKHYDKVVLVSKAAGTGFNALYPELCDKTQVCYNLIDTERIKSLSDAGCDFDIEGFTIITVARMDNKSKRITRTLEVIEKLKDEGYAFTWLFLGDGVDFDALQRYSKVLNLSSHVIWTGHTDNPYCYMKKADIFALLSLYEGNPLVIYESLLSGTPVVSTYYDTDEANIPADTGWYVENNFDAIYNKMKYLLDNKDLINKAKSRLSDYTYDTAQCERQVLKIFTNANINRELNG